MKAETILLLRKLAREATIFALLGMVVAAIGIFVYMDNEDRANAKVQAAKEVHAVEGMYAVSAGGIANTVEVPLTNGAVLHVRKCEPEGPWAKYQPKPKFDPNASYSAPDCRDFSNPFINVADPPPVASRGDR